MNGHMSQRMDTGNDQTGAVWMGKRGIYTASSKQLSCITKTEISRFSTLRIFERSPTDKTSEIRMFERCPTDHLNRMDFLNLVLSKYRASLWV